MSSEREVEKPTPTEAEREANEQAGPGLVPAILGILRRGSRVKNRAIAALIVACVAFGLSPSEVNAQESPPTPVVCLHNGQWTTYYRCPRQGDFDGLKAYCTSACTDSRHSPNGKPQIECPQGVIPVYIEPGSNCEPGIPLSVQVFHPEATTPPPAPPPPQAIPPPPPSEKPPQAATGEQTGAPKEGSSQSAGGTGNQGGERKYKDPLGGLQYLCCLIPVLGLSVIILSIDFFAKRQQRLYQESPSPSSSSSGGGRRNERGPASSRRICTLYPDSGFYRSATIKRALTKNGNTRNWRSASVSRSCRKDLYWRTALWSG